MDARVQKFTEFIAGDVTCVIPVYQRNYSWKTANCERLFDDVVKIIKEGKHFIGTFVYQKNDDSDIFQSYVIIDGQQRITSIILLAKAIYDLTDKEDLKADILSRFIKHTSGGEMKNKFRLRPTEFDREIFAKIMDGETNFSDEEKKRFDMYKNYRFFREKISSAKIDLRKLFNAICKLNVVSIGLNENEKPQEIFESLNSTGLELSNADLVRNFLLMQLEYDQQKELYKNYWLKIENLLQSSKVVEDFITQYLIFRKKSNVTQEKKQLSPKNLYEEFKTYFRKNYVEPGKNVENCLSDMLRYAKFFSRGLFKTEQNPSALSAPDRKFYELTFQLKATNTPIILMHLLDHYEQKHLDETTFIEFVDALISLAFRAKMCGRNGIDQQMAGNILRRLGDALDTDSFWKAITGGKGGYTFPNDAEFQTALRSSRLGESVKDSNFFKYYLYSLEKTLSQELPAYSEIVVEQVLPQNLGVRWQNYLTEQNDLSNAKQWINSPGNWVLVDKKESGTFDKKKIRYKQSQFCFTRAIGGCSNWTSSQIQARAKKLSDAAVKVWILPEEFNETDQSTTNLLYLDSDFSECKGRKPVSYSFAGDAKPVSNWKNLVYGVSKQLFSLDEKIFRRVIKSDNIPKRKNLFLAEPSNFKISDDLYLSLNCDTENCLKILKALVETFDKLCETNFKEDIYFILRQE